MRQVEIQSRMFQVRMAHQKLNGSQIGSRLHQVGGETVPQGVIMVLTISFPLKSAIAITRATEQKSNLFAI